MTVPGGYAELWGRPSCAEASGWLWPATPSHGQARDRLDRPALVKRGEQDVAARGDRAPRARQTEATSCTNSKASRKPLISMIRMQPTPLTQSRYKHLAREAVLKAREKDQR
jgi:hypothetical protein